MLPPKKRMFTFIAQIVSSQGEELGPLLQASKTMFSAYDWIKYQWSQWWLNDTYDGDNCNFSDDDKTLPELQMLSSVNLNWRGTLNDGTIGLNWQKCHESSQWITNSTRGYNFQEPQVSRITLWRVFSKYHFVGLVISRIAPYGCKGSR